MEIQDEYKLSEDKTLYFDEGNEIKIIEHDWDNNQIIYLTPNEIRSLVKALEEHGYLKEIN